MRRENNYKRIITKLATTWGIDMPPDFGRSLFLHAARMLDNKSHLAEDFVSDLFAKLWIAPPIWADVKVPAAYIMRMLTNSIISYFNEMRKNPLDNCIAELDPNRTDDASSDNSSCFGRISSVSQVMRVAATFNSRNKEIFRLKFIKGFEDKKIASTLNIELHAVKYSVRCIKKEFRKRA